MRERAALVDRWLEIRFEMVLPEIMRRDGVDMWIVAAREYNEDPVIRTMLPYTWLAARRRTVLLFFDRGAGGGRRAARGGALRHRRHSRGLGPRDRA